MNLKKSVSMPPDLSVRRCFPETVNGSVKNRHASFGVCDYFAVKKSPHFVQGFFHAVLPSFFHFFQLLTYLVIGEGMAEADQSPQGKEGH